MRRLILILVMLILAPSLIFPQRKSRQGATGGPRLTLVVAQRVLGRQINEPSVDNMLLTCRACYSDEDKGENDNFAVVSTYSNMNQYLRRQGYIRLGRDGEVFTAKAKRSKYFEAYGDGQGGFGGAGFRFANFRNPRITVNTITDLKRVPVEYDLVPTEITIGVFGKAQRVKSFVAFSYEDRKWTICIGCSRN